MTTIACIFISEKKCFSHIDKGGVEVFMVLRTKFTEEKAFLSDVFFFFCCNVDTMQEHSWPWQYWGNLTRWWRTRESP